MFESIAKTVALISTKAKVSVLGRETEKENLMTCDWHMPVSKEPALYAFAIKKSRYTYKLIEKSKIFVVNILPYPKKDAAEFCGTKSGEFIDKFKESGLTKIEAEKLNCSCIKEATTKIECELFNEIEAGDHQIIIGKIISIHENREKKPLIHFQKKYTTLKNATS